jgi:serine protease inhibitor
MRTARLLLSLSLCVGTAGCESLFGPGGKAPPQMERLPRALSVAELQVIQASNRFAFGLLRETVAGDTARNVFLSPLSASMALGMAMNGAAGATLEEMRETLGFAGMSLAEVNASYRDLTDLLLKLDAGVEMRIANALWLRQGFPLNAAFVQTTGSHFGAATQELDFSSPASLDVINGWASRSTNGRIPKVLDRLDPDVVLYLMNAIYFKGNWTTQFDARRTAPAPFYRADGSQQPVQMMSAEKVRARMAHTPEAQILDLPYARGAFSMTLVMPHPDGALDALVSTLDEARWNGWIGQLQPLEVHVQMPRFKLEYGSVLNSTLQALGMRVPFDHHAADFSAMSPRGADLYIYEVLQKTFLEVNEKGTEAAAVTSVGVGPVSAPPSFRADRPFLLVIRERLSGTILFIGSIGAPPSR